MKTIDDDKIYGELRARALEIARELYDDCAIPIDIAAAMLAFHAEAVAAYKADSERWADKQLPQSVVRQDACIWIQDSDGPWNTSCGVTWEYMDGGPHENKANFCHHCGGVLLPDEDAAIAASKEDDK